MDETNLKKIYMTPEAEKIQFNYRDQVVAASGDDEDEDWMKPSTCYYAFA